MDEPFLTTTDKNLKFTFDVSVSVFEDPLNTSY